MVIKTLLCSLLFSLPCLAGDKIHIVSKEANIDITTRKVSHITDVVNFPSEFIFEKEIADTVSLSGPRVIIIDSPGGRVDVGQVMIETMLLEKKRGTKMICVVNEAAHSMAFNFLTMCDVRLATANAHFVVHKIAMGGIDPNIRLTAKALRQIAEMLDRDDEPFRQNNSKAMHLTLKEYDQFADDQRMWSTPMLYLIGYLDGVATIDGNTAVTEVRL